MPDLRRLGTISLLQVQSASLMRETPVVRLFDPAPLRCCEALEISSAGAIGLNAEGQRIVDVHNANHPETRYRGMNTLSFGFDTHLQMMSDRFGRHLTPGCAGENLIIATEHVIELTDVAAGILIRSVTDVVLTDVMVAEPCAPFARFALQRPDLTPTKVKEALQYLGHGIRGFYCRAVVDQPVRIQIGDSVFARIAPSALA
ncbi:MAG: hypothetical protein K9N01_08750 [Cephaloticoccus sp.]|nr:hypothetical protein [Cephaloticoccus sp.]